MTSYLVVRKSHSRCFNDIFYAWNVFAKDFIDEQPGTMIRIHIPSKFCCVGLRTVKFCHPMRQMWVKTSQYPCVISPNPVGHSDKVMKHLKVAFSSICELPYRLYSYIKNIQVTGPVGNSSYQAEKPVTLSVRGIGPVEKQNLVFDYQKCQPMMLTGVVEGYWHIRGGPFSLDFHKVSYSAKYYVTVYFVFVHWVTFLITSPEMWKRKLHE